jgi:hypothetical protein
MWLILGVIGLIFIILFNTDDDENSEKQRSSWLTWMLIGFLLGRSNVDNDDDDDSNL